VVPRVDERVEDGHPLVERDAEIVEAWFLLPLDLGVVAEHFQRDRVLVVEGLLFDFPLGLLLCLSFVSLCAPTVARGLDLGLCLFVGFGLGFLLFDLRTHSSDEVRHGNRHAGPLHDEQEAGDAEHVFDCVLPGAGESLVDQRVVHAVDAVERRGHEEQPHRREVADLAHPGLRAQERDVRGVVHEVQQHEVEGEHADQEHRCQPLEEPATAAAVKGGVVLCHQTSFPPRNVGTLATTIAPVSRSDA